MTRASDVAKLITNGGTIVDGNIALASGHGIDFSATSDASGMTSELLDDYEEGSFTPVVSDASSGGNTASWYFCRTIYKSRKTCYNLLFFKQHKYKWHDWW